MEKPKIQYVGQFYVHGSEAPKLTPQKPRRRPRTTLPLERLRKVEKVTLDPVAWGAIAAAVVLLLTMVAGGLQLRSDWIAYQEACELLDDLSQENAQLDQKYHTSFDLKDIRLKAESLGLVPAEQVRRKTVYVTYPQPEPEPNPVVEWLQEIRWFWNGLWEGAA